MDEMPHSKFEIINEESSSLAQIEIVDVNIFLGVVIERAVNHALPPFTVKKRGMTSAYLPVAGHIGQEVKEIIQF